MSTYISNHSVYDIDSNNTNNNGLHLIFKIFLKRKIVGLSKIYLKPFLILFQIVESNLLHSIPF